MPSPRKGFSVALVSRIIAITPYQAGRFGERAVIYTVAA
jgi:hypothetical protein